MLKGFQHNRIHAYMREAWKGTIRSLSTEELRAMPNVTMRPTDFLEYFYEVITVVRTWRCYFAERTYYDARRSPDSVGVCYILANVYRFSSSRCAGLPLLEGASRQFSSLGERYVYLRDFGAYLSALIRSLVIAPFALDSEPHQNSPLRNLCQLRCPWS